MILIFTRTGVFDFKDQPITGDIYLNKAILDIKNTTLNSTNLYIKMKGCYSNLWIDGIHYHDTIMINTFNKFRKVGRLDNITQIEIQVTDINGEQIPLTLFFFRYRN